MYPDVPPPEFMDLRRGTRGGEERRVHPRDPTASYTLSEFLGILRSKYPETQREQVEAHAGRMWEEAESAASTPESAPNRRPRAQTSNDNNLGKINVQLLRI